jgi:hypothetical protein
VPFGNEVVLICSDAGGAGLMRSERVAVAVWPAVVPPESVTFTVTLNCPEADGVPEIPPVCGLILNPEGSPVADHVYGWKPPDTAIPAA